MAICHSKCDPLVSNGITLLNNMGLKSHSIKSKAPRTYRNITSHTLQLCIIRTKADMPVLQHSTQFHFSSTYNQTEQLTWAKQVMTESEKNPEWQRQRTYSLILVWSHTLGLGISSCRLKAEGMTRVWFQSAAQQTGVRPECQWEFTLSGWAFCGGT